MTTSLIAGVDEAGRGPLAGPVVAAAVICADDKLVGVKDSKLLTPAKREELFHIIMREAMSIGIGMATVAEIDSLNILEATMLAFKRAVWGLNLRPELILVDGNRAPDFGITTNTVIGGDGKFLVIGAASIIAKVTRDRLMREYDLCYPQYGFAKHQGYGTKQHLEALLVHGPCPWHRKSFGPVKNVAVCTP